MPETLSIACLQHDTVWENPEANRQQVEAAFASLQHPVDLLVVPETFTTGFSDNMAAQAEPPEGDTYRWACQLAQQHNALFVGTWTVCLPDSQQVINRLHWVRPDGTYGFYDKAHTFRMSSEASQLARGTKREVFEWRGWRIRPAVCYDLRFPTWLRNTNPPSYDLLLICANWPGSRHQAWTTLLRARAIENLCYAVGVNRVGTDGTGIPYAGYSSIVDYRGLPVQVEERCHRQSTLLTATLQMEPLLQFRQHWPFFLDFD